MKKHSLFYFNQIKKKIIDGELPLLAGSLSFSTILAFIPFLALTLYFFKYFGGVEFLAPKIEGFFVIFFREATGKEAATFLRETLDRITETSKLGLGSAIALFVAALRLMFDMENAFNRIWGIEKARSFLRRILFMIGLYFLFPIGLALYTGFRSVGFLKPMFYSDFQNITEFISIFVGMFILYIYVPAAKVNRVSCLVGTLVASFCLTIVMNSFSSLTKSFFNYSKIYGSIAAIPLICILILVSWWIILVGAIISASGHSQGLK